MKAAVESEDAIVPILSGNMEVAKPHSELIKLCEEMDSNGLHKFISDNRKHLSAIREEIPFALKTAKDPARLVLNSLKGFYSMEMQTRDSNLLGIRRTCIMLMECFSQLLEYSEVSCISDAIISDDTKEEAKIIATEWKPKLDDLDIDASSGNSLEAHAFLQLLATYGIATEFDQEEIFKLIPTVSRRRQTSALCRSLGLSDKMPGVIGILVNSGRYLDAINMAYAFELTEQFSPVPLLKSYLKEARKTSSPVKSGNTAPTAQNEVNERELMALKFVLKCIEEHKLEEQYPVDPLQKRVVQLEKAKADKKRVVEAAKPQSKRPRASGGGYVPRSSNNTMDKTFYTTGPDRYPTYMYERPYVYTGPTNNNHASGVPAYNLAPTHAYHAKAMKQRALAPEVTSSSKLKMGGGKHEADTQSKVVCQMCNLEGRIASKCPWVYTKYKKATCNGIMKLMISLTENNYERKFLKCQHSICGSFQWLSDVVNQANGAE
ncbi:hypothetical protein GIB67_032828 [Kingdonia uniflora]|uniref:FRIGIDA-like protein n=1 Tax=Kingdonia uniflora TaxID=39325 RepID=A0A7J7NC64_9MAGN|nr:hypothetical protein GIB67_032828 [Kingdonia uniflora]